MWVYHCRLHAFPHCRSRQVVRIGVLSSSHPGRTSDRGVVVGITRGCQFCCCASTGTGSWSLGLLWIYSASTKLKIYTISGKFRIDTIGGKLRICLNCGAAPLLTAQSPTGDRLSCGTTTGPPLRLHGINNVVLITAVCFDI